MRVSAASFQIFCTGVITGRENISREVTSRIRCTERGGEFVQKELASFVSHVKTGLVFWHFPLGPYNVVVSK